MTGLKYFQELDQVARQLWEHLDDTIIKPRTDISNQPLCSIVFFENGIEVNSAEPDETIEVSGFDNSHFSEPNNLGVDNYRLLNAQTLTSTVSSPGSRKLYSDSHE